MKPTRGGFRLEHGRQAVAAVLADHDDDLALAGLVFGQAAVTAVLAQVGGLHVAAEIGAIDCGLLALAADLAAAHLGGHRLAHLVAENERRLVGQAKVAAHGEHALALHFVAEDRDGREVHAQRELVRGEQRPDVIAEILLAGLAPEARARRSGGGTRRRPDRRTSGRPARRPSRPSGLRGTCASASASDMRNTVARRERLGLAGEEEVLRHRSYPFVDEQICTIADEHLQ